MIDEQINQTDSDEQLNGKIYINGELGSLTATGWLHITLTELDFEGRSLSRKPSEAT